MIYPSFLKPGDTIGVCAPSGGNSKEFDRYRFQYAKQHFEEKGFSVLPTNHVLTGEEHGRSADAKIRKKELMDLWEDPHVPVIISAKGGDYFMEILPCLDFEKMAKTPTLFQGFSDNTCLTFPLTVLCDMASVYGTNFNDFAMSPWHPALEQNVKILQKQSVTQCTFPYYENAFYEEEDPTAVYHKDLPSVAICDKERVTVQGRMLGGCLDVLITLCGTPYGSITPFLEKYAEDGILWYLESFATDDASLIRSLWQLKEAGWFQTAKGFIFGRPMFFESSTGYTYEEGARLVLKDCHVPLIFQTDIGHKAPQFTIVNGSVGTWTYESGKSEFTMDFR